MIHTVSTRPQNLCIYCQFSTLPYTSIESRSNLVTNGYAITPVTLDFQLRRMRTWIVPLLRWGRAAWSPSHEQPLCLIVRGVSFGVDGARFVGEGNIAALILKCEGVLQLLAIFILIWVSVKWLGSHWQAKALWDTAIWTRDCTLSHSWSLCVWESLGRATFDTLQQVPTLVLRRDFKAFGKCTVWLLPHFGGVASGTIEMAKHSWGINFLDGGMPEIYQCRFISLSKLLGEFLFYTNPLSNNIVKSKNLRI